MFRSDFSEFWNQLTAFPHPLRTSGMEVTARGGGDGRRDFSLQYGAILFDEGIGDGDSRD